MRDATRRARQPRLSRASRDPGENNIMMGEALHPLDPDKKGQGKLAEDSTTAPGGDQASKGPQPASVDLPCCPRFAGARRSATAERSAVGGRSWACRVAGAAVLCGFGLLQGCLFFSPQDELERLKVERGEPWATTVFAKSPGPGEQPLEALRETLTYWSAPGSGGVPRWKGVLTPEPEDLYESILARMDQGADRFTLVAHEYEHHLTLVDYLGAKGERLGWDHPAFPAPKKSLETFPLVGFYNLEWWEFPQLLLLDLPV